MLKIPGKRRIILIVLLCLIAAGAVLCAFMIRYVWFSSSRSSIRIRKIIGIPDPPETVALRWMQACQTGNAKRIGELASKECLEQFFIRAALNEPSLAPDQVLNAYAKQWKAPLKDAAFKIEKDPFFTSPDRQLRFTVRILHPDQSVTAMRLLIEPDPDGGWKCAGME